MLVEVVSIGMADEDEIMTGLGTALEESEVDVSMGVAELDPTDLEAGARVLAGAGAEATSSPLNIPAAICA